MSLDVKWTDLKDIAFFRLKILSIKTEYDNECFVSPSKIVDVLMVHKTDICCMSCISYPVVSSLPEAYLFPFDNNWQYLSATVRSSSFSEKDYFECVP